MSKDSKRIRRQSSQSPVDLSQAVTIVKKFTPLQLSPNYSSKHTAFIINTGHTISVKIISTDSPPTVSGGGLKHEYVFDNFHFHWESEHKVDGKRYPLENHFVHYAKKYKNVDTAKNYEGGLAVLSAFYDISPHANPIFDNLIASVANVAHKCQKPVKLKAKLVLSDLLPDDKTNYYRYLGSLTTPPYCEGVIWTVFLKPCNIITNFQLAALTQIWDEHNKPVKQNSRETQEVNERCIYLSKK